MPVVAELRNVIIGDDTQWRAAVVRTQESLAALQAQSQQATASIATAFSGMGAPVAGATAGFQALSNEAQVAGAVVANSGRTATAGIEPLNGAAAQAAQSMAGLGTSAVQAGAGVSELALRKAQLIGQLNNVNTAIRAETSVLGSAQAAVQNLGTGHAALNNAVRESEANLAGYILRQAALKGELGAVNAAINGTTSAHRVAAPALLATGAATGELGGKTNILTALMTAQTTQISSQRTIWAGYDNVIQAVIRTMGGIPVAAALAITIFGILAEKLLHLGDEKKEQIRLDRELIETDIQLWQAMNTGTLFTQQYATVLHDINAVNAQVKTTTEALLVARAEEADAIKKSSTVASDYAATTSDLQTKVAAYVVSLFSQVKGETEATAARIAASKAMAEAVELEIRAAAASGKTIEQLIAERQASGATAAELGLLASAWGTATAARATYESGRTALSTLKLELAQAAASRGEVLQGTKATTALKNAIAGLPPEQRKLVEQSQLVEKSLRELNKTTDAHAKSAGVARSAVSQYTEGVMGLNKAVNVVSASLATGTFGKLFEDLPTKARKGAEDLKQAAQVIVKELDDLLKHATSEGFKFAFSDKDLKPTIASLQALGATGVQELGRLSEAAKVVQEELTKFKLAAINLKQPIFEVPYAVMRDGFGNITAAGERIIAVVQKIGGIIKEVLPGVGTVITQAMIDSVNATSTATGEIEAMGKSWLVSLGQIKAGVPPAADAIGRLRQAIHDMREDIAADPLFNALRMTEEAARAYDDVINLTRTKGELLGLTQNETNELILHNLDVFGARFGEKWGISADQAIAVFKRQMDKLPGALDEIFNKLFLGAKHAVSGIFDVIANIPGKIGDTLRKGTDEFTKWVNQIDGILKGLHKIFNSIPDGLGEALTKFIGIFRTNTAQVQQSASVLGTTVNDASQNWSEAMEAMGSSTSGAVGVINSGMGAAADAVVSHASRMIGAIGGIIGGLSLLFGPTPGGNRFTRTITGTLLGIGGGALAGFATGAMFGSAFGPIGAGIGALVGGVVGLFRGLFSGGKSDAQKKAEQEAAERAKVSMQDAAVTVMTNAMNGLKAGLEMFEKLADFTKVPEKTIHRFFNQLEIVIQEFIDLSKQFGNDLLAAAKSLAENIGPIIQVIGGALEAFEALGGFTGVAQISVNAFSSAMTRVLQSFIAIKDKFLDAEGFIDTTVNQARKFASKIGDIIIVIKDALDAFSGFQTFKNVLPETLDAFAATLQLAINKMGAIAEAVDKVMIKTAQRFSDRAASVVSLIGAAVAAFTPLAKFAGVPAAAFDALFEGIKISVVRMQDLVALINVEMLNLASSIADKVGPIVSIIGTAVEAFKGLIELKAVPLASIGLLVDGIRQAIDLMIPLAATIDVDMADKASIIADKTNNVVELIGKAVDGFSKLAEFKGVPAIALAALFEGIKDASARMQEFAATIDAEMMDKASEVAGKVSVIVGLIGNALTAFTPLANFKGLAADALTALFEGIKDGVAKMQEIAATMDAGMLDAAIVIATKVDTIFGVIGRAASVLENLANFRGVAPGTFQMLLDGFNVALAILNEMLNKATLFESIAIAIEDKLVSAAKHLQAGATAVAAALASATTATGGLSGGTSVASLSAGPSVTGFGVGAPSSPFAPSGGGSTVVETYHVNVTVQGSMLGTKAELQDVVVGAITQAQRRGRAPILQAA